MDVSIIIVNFNTLELTRNCIDSIYALTEGVSFEVIVVDNNSKDNSKEILEKDSRIIYIYSKENLGFGRANNVGMMLAKGQYFFLLNSDTILVNNAIKQFYDNVSTRKELAFYGSWLLKKDGTFNHSYASLPTMKSELLDLLKSYLVKATLFNGSNQGDSYVDADFYDVGYVTGADLFFNRNLYDKYGGFDSSFFLYYEETDWQARLKKEGIKSYVIKGPSIIHLEGASSKNKKGKKNALTKKMYIKSRFLYFDRHYSKMQSFLFRLVYNIFYLPIYIYRHFII